MTCITLGLFCYTDVSKRLLLPDNQPNHPVAFSAYLTHLDKGPAIEKLREIVYKATFLSLSNTSLVTCYNVQNLFYPYQSLRHRCPQPILAILFRPFGFIAIKTLNYLAFKSFDFERTFLYLMKVIPKTRHAH